MKQRELKETVSKSVNALFKSKLLKASPRSHANDSLHFMNKAESRTDNSSAFSIETFREKTSKEVRPGERLESLRITEPTPNNFEGNTNQNSFQSSITVIENNVSQTPHILEIVSEDSLS